MARVVDALLDECAPDHICQALAWAKPQPSKQSPGPAFNLREAATSMPRRVAVLMNWPVMVRLLLDDATTEQLGEQGWTNLLLVLRCAVHKATGGALCLQRPDARYL